MEIKLSRTSEELQFDVSNEYSTIQVGANKSVIDSEKTFRPMELLLASLASCSAIDILTILKKQKQEVHHFEIQTHGVRADAVPAIFEKITLQIKVWGSIDAKKLEKAINLTKEKYCSVYKILSQTASIDYQFTILPKE